ncbi:Mannose-1-phosphate guanylyltransferase (GDP) [Lunatimonas lonarensis]|uniref:Mannose-1-phosphate guanylyltransferase (GDP) n=1 Tax=Lunatimonas lonarensis TaxID=1232681 RepID=R7ZS73_9BACT|nr:mannose-1-phosphate guanylyltransferase [Lunatimonas lonarensis]EON76937.1 Mannose-1-phosphate guanylyltransferase (GDP) [Lunatimonas lonarensis]
MQPYIVILAGGLGAKLWPESRHSKPKQFLDLLGTGRTLLQMTYDRFLPKFSKDRFLVITTKKYLNLVKEQLPELDEQQILLEPIRRNTAASLGLVAYLIRKLDPDAEVIVSPSDQVVFNETAFFGVLDVALQASRIGHRLVTVGIQPHSPETGYGYIQYLEGTTDPVKKVKTFTEKPDLALAQTFLESGDFLWNSGIFIWKNESFIRAIELHMPEMAEVFEEGDPYFEGPEEAAFLRKAYSLIKNISVNAGILVKSDDVYVVTGNFGWSDLGTWRTLFEFKNKNHGSNVAEGHALLFDAENCFVKAGPNRLVVVQGLKDYLVADSENVVLICKIEEENRFREFLNGAKDKGAEFI